MRNPPPRHNVVQRSSRWRPLDVPSHSHKLPTRRGSTSSQSDLTHAQKRQDGDEIKVLGFFCPLFGVFLLVPTSGILERLLVLVVIPLEGFDVDVDIKMSSPNVRRHHHILAEGNCGTPYCYFA